MQRYDIVYHMRPDCEDIVLTIPANTEEEAIVFAKRFRKDGFSIREHKEEGSEE